MTDKTDRPLVPPNIRDLSPYVAGKTIAEVQKAYRPPRISKLASNENRLGCSDRVQAAVSEAMEEIQDYPDPASRRLRAMLAERNGIGTENIIVASGSESIIAILCRTFFQNHEVAVTADATFVGFFVQAGIRGVELIKVPVTDEYGFDLDAMAEAIDERTKMVYIANPNNPTGTYIDRAAFETFMEKVPEDVLVIMDEAYYEYAEAVEDYPHSLEYGFKNVLTLRTFSKAYGLAGMRVGYAMGPERLIAPMLKTKLTFEPTALAQAAAEAALEDEEFLEESRRVVEAGRKQLYYFFDLHSIRYVPSISNSVLMLLDDPQKAADYTQGLLEQGVIVRRTNAFGLPQAIRITIGTEEEMNHLEESLLKVADRIEQN